MTNIRTLPWSYFLFSSFNFNYVRQSSITVSLALIIEASFEAYFQFWLQSNYSLTDILDILDIDITNMENPISYRSVSILLSFITITVSIVKIRFNKIFFYKFISPKYYLSNKDKNEALGPLSILILVLKVLMDLVSRVLIFFIFMIVHNNGQFSPLRTLTSFYTMVGIMTIFNIVFNERRNFCSVKYWLGKCYILVLVMMVL